jgi:hypothetical protein
MFGFLVGIASLAGLAYVLHHPDGHWNGGFGRPGVRFALRRLFARLDTTPSQEKVIRRSVDDLLDRLEVHRAELKRSRKDLAAAFAGEELDSAKLAEVFAAHDAVFSEARRDITGALLSVHEVLDDRQRRKLAGMIESGRLWSHGGARCHGPYRTAAAEEVS